MLSEGALRGREQVFANQVMMYDRWRDGRRMCTARLSTAGSKTFPTGKKLRGGS